MVGRISEGLVRRNVTMFRSSEQIMRELREKLEATSDAEVVRYALRYFERMLLDHANGYSLLVQHPKDPEADFTVTYQSLHGRVGEDHEPVKRNILMGEATTARLDKMKRIVGVSSDSEIIRRALRYLALLLQEAERGALFLLTNGQENVYVRMDILATSEPSYPRELKRFAKLSLAAVAL